jgi:hypothetical protein
MFAITGVLGYRCTGCNSFLQRSNFYPADFPPELPNLSFKELGGSYYTLIAGASLTMQHSSPSTLALWMRYSFADDDKPRARD